MLFYSMLCYYQSLTIRPSLSVTHSPSFTTWMRTSVSLSIEAVASSITKIRGLRKRTRAMLCEERKFGVDGGGERK